MNNSIEWKKSSIDYDKLNQITHKSLVSSQEKSIEHKNKIGKGNKGKIRTDDNKVKIKEALKTKMNNLSDEDRKKIYSNKSMLGKKHSEDTKKKMRESALGKVISEHQKQIAREKSSIAIIATNIKTGEITEYSSTKQAKEILGLTGILHVLKGRYKQCGGYYFKYKDTI
jgi:hypothetical protein